jgi:threonylcarbamoyladenosine tRNA methylthiotransferase MtaB
VPGAAVRDRAARLRAAGEAALARHLDSRMGCRHAVLTESPRIGRTEQFAEVLFAADQPEGRIVAAEITGRDGGRLTARAV